MVNKADTKPAIFIPSISKLKILKKKLTGTIAILRMPLKILNIVLSLIPSFKPSE